MKTITTQEAYNLLSECAAIISDDYALMYPSLQDIEEDSEFLILSWDDGDEEYRYDFYPRNNQTVNIEGSFMYLYDEIGTCIRLTLLAGMPLE